MSEIVPFTGGVPVAVDDSVRVSESLPSRSAAALAESDPVMQARIATEEAVFQNFEQHLAARGIRDPRVMEAALAWYESYEPDHGARDEIEKAQCERILRKTWGPDFEANRRHIRALCDQLPAESAELLLDARGPDGKAVFNDPFVLELFAKVARGLAFGFEHTHRSPQASSDIEREIREIEEVMRTDRRRYNRDEPMQARLRELYALKGGR